MSIENTLERIAVALEAIAQGGAPANLNAPAKPTPAAAPAPRAAKAAPAAAEPVAPVADAKVYTQAEVLETLKTLADIEDFGSAETIALMVKHGANKETPAVRTIPAANYGALMLEATGLLKKHSKAKGKIA